MSAAMHRARILGATWLATVTACAGARVAGDDHGGAVDAAPFGDDDASVRDDAGTATMPPCTPSDWMIEDVGLLGGNAVAVVADTQGGLHASYPGRGATFMYAHRPPSGGAWSVTELEHGQTFFVARESSIAVADDGTVYVAYTGSVGSPPGSGPVRLFVATRSPGAPWSTQTWTPSDVTFPLVVAGADDAHLFYHQSGWMHEDVRVGTGPWTHRPEVYAWGLGSSADLADGVTHVALWEAVPARSSHAVYGALRPGADWGFERLGVTTYLPTVRVDDQRAIHVAFLDGDLVLRHAMRPHDGSWTLGEVPVTSRDDLPGLGIDRQGRVHVAATTGHDAAEHVMRSPGGTWSAPTALALGRPQIAMTLDGTLHVLGVVGPLSGGIEWRVRHAWACLP